MIEFVIRPWRKYQDVIFAVQVAPDFAFIQFGRRPVYLWDRNGIRWPAFLTRHEDDDE